MASCMLVFKRQISTSACRLGKRNFRKFLLYNKRGSIIFKKQQKENPDSDIPIYKRGVRDIGFVIDGQFEIVPEKVPELIVPDLTDFKLKPYVSYRVPDVIQSEFTAKDLFNSVYAAKIISDLKADKLNEDGSPKEPSEKESLTVEEAKRHARQTGSDIF